MVRRAQHVQPKLAANLLEFLLAFVREDLRPKLVDPFGRRHIDEEIAKVGAGLSTTTAS
ncbi:hypothetical protein [Streptomyces sp. NBC_01363]|uniref:hypothetical protein n=1 Tax=Streptomyces sp. NBC_01363 TaxID=2903840 RepID=UPI002251D47F|nr:hypothetical protein [Streptomyces sp. NBC_01363]MCX4736603.1 hypothetical protein [Streptomyces sp. NBC_01363]